MPVLLKHRIEKNRDTENDRPKKFIELEVISKFGFSVEIKTRPRINPQAYSSMSRT
jgi:hypothetical protein